MAKAPASQPRVSCKNPRRETPFWPGGAEEFISCGHKLNSFHGDRARRTTHRAQAAPDAPGFVLDDGALFAGSRHAAVAREKRGLQTVVAAQMGGVHQAQAILRANVRAAAAENALVAVEDRADVAFEAAIRLQP